MKIPILSQLWGKEPRRPLNLLAPDLVCEAHIHILGDGTSKMYVSKLPPETSPEQLVFIVKTLIDQAVAFGTQHGIQVRVTQEGGAPAAPRALSP